MFFTEFQDQNREGEININNNNNNKKNIINFNNHCLRSKQRFDLKRLF